MAATLVPVLQALAVLTERRPAVAEAAIDTRLALGLHDEALQDLEPLVADHPFRERLRAEQMVALYRTGRQAEALFVFASARRMLVEELGLQPSAVLQRLQQAVLEGRTEIDAPGTAFRPGPAPRRTRLRGNDSQLPSGAAGFVGREAVTGRLTALLDPCGGAPAEWALTVVSGPAGTGKSALVNRVARAVCDRYPGGRLYADLRTPAGTPARRPMPSRRCCVPPDCRLRPCPSPRPTASASTGCGCMAAAPSSSSTTPWTKSRSRPCCPPPEAASRWSLRAPALQGSPEPGWWKSASSPPERQWNCWDALRGSTGWRRNRRQPPESHAPADICPWPCGSPVPVWPAVLTALTRLAELLEGPQCLTELSVAGMDMTASPARSLSGACSGDLLVTTELAALAAEFTSREAAKLLELSAARTEYLLDHLCDLRLLPCDPRGPGAPTRYRIPLLVRKFVRTGEDAGVCRDAPVRVGAVDRGRGPGPGGRPGPGLTRTAGVSSSGRGGCAPR